MLLLLFKKTTETISVISGRTEPRYLVLDDSALILFIEQKIIEAKFEHLKIIDGYPLENISIPIIAIEHSDTIDRSFALEKNKKVLRDYEIYILAPTKGLRDDLSQFIYSLIDHWTETDDDRINIITNIETNSVFNLPAQMVPVHEIYYYLEFDGINSYGTIINQTNFNSLTFTVDLDLMIITNVNSTIVDKYTASEFKGYKFYILDEALTLSLGVGNKDFTTLVDFAPYFGQRTQVSFTYEFTGTQVKLKIYINGTIAVSSTFAWIFPIDYGTKNITIAAFKTPSSTYQEFTKLRLYSARISDQLYTLFDIISEHVQNNYDTDLAFYKANEGKFDTIYNRNQDSNLDIILSGNYTWVNYLTKYSKKSIIRQTKNILSTEGILPL